MKEFLENTLFTVGEKAVTGRDLLLASAVLAAGMLISSIIARVVGRRVARGKLGERMSQPIQKTVFWCLLAATLLTTLSLIQIPISSFAFLGGALAIGIGFGAQNVLNNFISGWILIAERPVRVGDFVEISGHEGRIQAIGGRSTRVRRVDGIDILVPNSHLLENTIINWTLTDDLVRTAVRVGVAYDSDVQVVRELLAGVLDAKVPKLSAPPPEVLLVDFGDNAITFEVLFWCQAAGNLVLRRVRSEIRFAIDAAFREGGITIAFPQRDVHLDASTPVPVRMVTTDGGS